MKCAAPTPAPRSTARSPASFASWSEALWTETRAYPYLAVLQTNNDPTITGTDAPGAGIFLHHWMNAPTEGCVALPLASLLHDRWLTSIAKGRGDLDWSAIALDVDEEKAVDPP